MPRGGKQIKTPDRVRLVEAFNRGEDYVAAARTLNIKPDTAYRIVKKNHIEPSQRGVRRRGRGKVTQEIKESIVALVDSNCVITLQQIRENIQATAQVTISSTTISRVLHGLLYSIKKVEVVPEARNSADNKAKRRDFAEWFQLVSHEDFVFIYESGFDLWQSRTRGRAKIGCPAKRVVDSQKTPHVTLILAVAPHHGIIHSQVLRGGAHKNHMLEFFTEVIRSAEDAGLNNPWIILDNAPCHAGIEQALCDANQVAPFPAYRIARLTPYSCELNPIESMFNVVKASAKQQLSELEIHRNADETLLAYRFRKMHEVIVAALPGVAQQKVTATFRHVIATVIPRALNLEDL